MDSNIQDIQSGKQTSIAKAITLIDSEDEAKYDLLRKLNPNPGTQTIGITGPPGAGKSSLTSALVIDILQKEPESKVAILAIDPSSPFNMGALLGDRIRMTPLYLDDRVYIRSLASKGSLGGLNPHTLEVLQLLQSADFDYVIIETVGVGQSEIEIAGLADTTILVLVPEAGDEIQIMKAGILEIADIIVVNKSDRPSADAMVKNLKLATHDQNIEILKTVASEGKGIDELYDVLQTHKGDKNTKRKALLQTKYVLDLIRKHRMSDINQKAIYDIIFAQLEDGQVVNIYQLSEEYE